MSNGHMSTYVDPEDMFADTRMSFGDHLEELRTHLWRAIKGFLIAMIFALCIGKYVVIFITAPVEEQLQAFYERTSETRYKEWMANAQREQDKLPPQKFQYTVDPNQWRKALHLPPLAEADAEPSVVDLTTTDPQVTGFVIKLASQYGRPQHVSTFNVTEAFMVYFKVSLVTGLVLGSPWIFYQIWMFIAAGLYPHEKRLVNVYLPFSIGLFLVGAAVCQFLVMPRAIEVLLSFNDWMGLEPDLRLNEWLSFAMWMPVIFGISFQTPLVMLFLFKIGIMDVTTFRGYRKIAWFLMAVFAAVITPTPDAMTMLFLWVPMGFLYELGIILCALQPQTPFEDVEAPEAEEMVEV